MQQAVQPPSDKEQSIRRIHLRRGFHRIFLILWVIYVVWTVRAFWYPDWVAMRDRRSAIAHYNNCIASPDTGDWFDRYRLSGSKDLSVSKADRCRAVEDREIAASGAEDGRDLIWEIPLVLFVPPFMMYGIIWGLCKTGWWVFRGFLDPAAPTHS